MFKEKRFELIIEYVNKNGYATNESISKELSIPFTTLRRDLNELHNQNYLIKVHGGAKTLKEKSILEANFSEKISDNIDQKKIIAEKALLCIKPNESVFLDAGSTTYFLAKIIKKDLNNRIYTNSILHAQVLANNGIEDINILPGRLKLKTNAIVGVETINSLKKYYFDVAFIGINAIDSDYNFYTTDEDEAEIKKIVVKNSHLAFALADKSKLNSRSFVKCGDKSQLAVIDEEV
ncbi:DeoR/GlpR family DNA-binding transcription regulator [Spiroplasma turonicum]|uniref:DeoR family transcriptional regulator n=1 Tax=Spiroplasma turonicum TaxID=216946 RepID=A0A0K1P5T1_9MOLU|nr:DeoR/GlpR family DNA-binding transcription regulator [Spiroplasma turonicum]AKU79610.1 DeoR family transcriptional regulator [Spiroplasma turonicum]ALX70632.1 DeoR family transcriptional regulator [Spiroplasma turonicum]